MSNLKWDNDNGSEEFMNSVKCDKYDEMIYFEVAYYC